MGDLTDAELQRILNVARKNWSEDDLARRAVEELAEVRRARSGPPREEELRRAARAVVDAYRVMREAGSFAGFWTHIDDLAAQLDGRAPPPGAGGEGA